MKKILSIIISLAVIITALVPFSSGMMIMNAQAADYASQLRSKGFPESYIDDLVELHNKYPNWIFQPLITNIKWSSAVSGERSTHSKQLIQKSSSTSSSMYCNCSSCYKNGNYVIQEASNWVSASQKAVEYYMDPRNWLNEKYIFQFESTKYDGTQTKAGVESILNGTWMHDSLITYKTTSGSTKTYNSTTKYSDAIMAAANDSGMSAYYLASKIRQENGGAAASASAVCGTVSPFQGIYNYYNIGANTGASDGLAWAAGYLKTNKSTTLYSSYSSSSGSVGGTKTAVASGQYMTWRANCGNYYYVRLYNENPYNEGKSGYIPKSAVRTTYVGDTSTGWGRPWSNPYKAIYYGAKYIAKNFATQTSGYLQKFNVNPESDTLYSHEYMANVAAAASESLTTYNAYKSANILGITKTFSIPVFLDMPNDNTSSVSLSAVSSLKITSFDTSSVTLSWSKTANATGYQIQQYRNGVWKTYTTTSTSIKITGLVNCAGYAFRIRAYRKSGSTTTYSAYSSFVKQYTKATKVSSFYANGTTASSITLAWTAHARAEGYRIYKYDSSSNSYKVYKNVTGTSLKITGLKNNTTYKFRIAAYRTLNGTKIIGTVSSTLSAKTVLSPAKVTGLKVSSYTTSSIAVKWSKPANATGYQVQIYRNGKWKTYTTTSTSKTFSGLTNSASYIFRVRAYTKSGGNTTYGPYSAQIKQCTKSTKVSGFSGESTNTTITLKWSKHARTAGYRIYMYDTKAKGYKIYKDVTGTSLKITGLKGNTKYKFVIAAYRTLNGKKITGEKKALSVTTKNKQVTLKSAVSKSTKRITVKWNKVSSATGYEVMWSTTSNFKSNFLSNYVKGASATSTTLKTAQSNKTYYVKVRAYKTSNGKKQYYSWSKTIRLKVK